MYFSLYLELFHEALQASQAPTLLGQKENTGPENVLRELLQVKGGSQVQQTAGGERTSTATKQSQSSLPHTDR